MGIRRWRPAQEVSEQEEGFLERMKQTGKLFAFLRAHRHELFDESFQQELEGMYRDTGAGKAPVPPGLMAMATLLQGYMQVSDATMVELTVFDLRVQRVGSVPCGGHLQPVGTCRAQSRRRRGQSPRVDPGPWSSSTPSSATPAPCVRNAPRLQKEWLSQEGDLGVLKKVYAVLPTNGSTTFKATATTVKSLKRDLLEAFKYGLLAVFEVVRPSIVLDEVVVRAAARRRINKLGFIDHDDGANIRTGPAESGGEKVREQPLPPATPVFVSSPHPDAPGWWQVTAYAREGIFRGYVQALRVNIDLPEPTAKLYQIKQGDNAETLAKQEFSSSVRPGHDLAYYENVLLYVNQLKGKRGITGSYQQRNLFGCGGNNIQLIEGERVWLVSPAFAKALEEVVPSGSLTGGAIADLREVAQAIQDAITRFARALLDILKSIDESPKYVLEILAEDAEVIREHFFEIVAVIGGFFALQGLAAALAGPASPLLIQFIAFVIELALGLFGLAAAAETASAAVQQGVEWLRLAIQANGRPEEIARASKEFLKMLKSLGLTVLSLMGVKANMGKAAKILNSIIPPMAPALVITNGGMVMMGNVGGRTAAILGPIDKAGPLGAGGAMMMVKGKKSGGSLKVSQDFPRKSLRGVSVNWLKRNKPRGWRQIPADKKGGWKWLDENGVERLRFMWKNGLNAAKNQWARQANGYFRWQNAAEEYLDINGNVVSKANPKFQELTHIPYEGL